MKLNSVKITWQNLSLRRRLIAPVGLLALLICTGCAESPEETFSVEGTVTVAGKLMTSGTVTFTMIDAGKSGKKYSARGPIDPQGHYRLTTFGKMDGAPAGKHKVCVIPNFNSLPDELGVNVMDLVDVPRIYMMPSTSPLIYDVQAGENVIDIDIPAEEGEL